MATAHKCGRDECFCDTLGRAPVGAHRGVRWHAPRPSVARGGVACRSGRLARQRDGWHSMHRRIGTVRFRDRERPIFERVSHGIRVRCRSVPTKNRKMGSHFPIRQAVDVPEPRCLYAGTPRGRCCVLGFAHVALGAASAASRCPSERRLPFVLAPPFGDRRRSEAAPRGTQAWRSHDALAAPVCCPERGVLSTVSLQ